MCLQAFTNAEPYAWFASPPYSSNSRLRPPVPAGFLPAALPGQPGLNDRSRYRTKQARAKLILRVGTKSSSNSHWPPDAAWASGPGLMPGVGHWVKALTPCWIVMCIFFLAALLLLPPQQVSNRLRLLPDRVTALQSPLHAGLRFPRPSGSSLRGVGSPREGSPRPHLADLQSHGVRWEAASGRAGAGEEWGSGSTARAPSPNRRGSSQLPKKWRRALSHWIY